MSQFAIHAFFSLAHFHKQRQAEICNQVKAKQQPEAELRLFENYWLSLSTLSFKNNKKYSKKCTKNKNVCLNAVI